MRRFIVGMIDEGARKRGAYSRDKGDKGPGPGSPLSVITIARGARGLSKAKVFGQVEVVSWKKMGGAE